MANRPRATLADYMVIAISPALIMVLVGSLVLFLLELLYQGQYQGRMQYVFVLFVFAAVLIGRISIEEGRERALGFSLVLGIAVLLVLNKFVDFSGFFARLSLVINIGLIVVILWCSNKLTWDCTVIDEQEDASGEGLLQTIGMDEEAEGGAPAGLDLEATSGSAPQQPPKPQPTSLWQRFVEARHKKHAPGVWVVYFSMAALPIFGIGQGFIFHQDLAGRRFVFQLLVAYVAAALGLLVTTSFLGLRRYLRQRRLEMPPKMAGAWLGVGGVMIVALLLFCMLLPRRNAEYSITHLGAFAQSPTDLKPNRWGFGNDGPEGEDAKRQGQRDDAKQPTDKDKTGGKQEGGKKQGQQEGGKQEGGKKQGQQEGGKQEGGKKQGQQEGGKQEGGKKQGQQEGGKQEGGKKQGQQEGGKQEGGKKQGQQEGGKQEGGKKQGQQEGGKQEGGKKQEDQAGSRDQEPPKEKQNEKASNQDQEPSESRQPQEQKSAEEKRQDSDDERSESKQPSDDGQTEKQTAEDKSRAKSESKFDPAKLVSQIGGGIGILLKLLYWLIAILIVGWFLWRYWDQVREAIRNFIQAMKEFWARLFGGKVEAAEGLETVVVETGPPPRPFSDFPNPFQSDLHAKLSAEQLVAYSFEAFEAWARERGYGRGPEQTPHEFAAIVGQAAAPLSEDAMRLAELYNRSAYSDDSLPAASSDYVRRFWSQLTAVNG